jgi:hypothetical protein
MRNRADPTTDSVTSSVPFVKLSLPFFKEQSLPHH